ncbi:MAG: DUF502 domain-containing protein [Bacteroidetes bacterium]|jgi:uncharacterized membrane protein|nr:DUF502 domain-containing protein [Bacteroidota bacterium]
MQLKMKKIASYFLQGVLFIAPAGITIYVVVLIFNFVDNILVDTKIPGLGALLVVAAITALGFIGNTIIAKPFFNMFDRFLQRAPLVKLIYTSLKDFLSAIVGKEKKFTKPVLVRVNTISELEKMGFLTQEDLTDFEIKDKVAVYFPHSYNFSGELFIVPKEHVRPVNISSSDAMKFIVSGGVTKYATVDTGDVTENSPDK